MEEFSLLVCELFERQKWRVLAYLVSSDYCIGFDQENTCLQVCSEYRFVL